MKRLIIVILIFVVLLQGCGLAGAAEPADYSKIIVMHMNISQGNVTEKSVEVLYGHAPDPGRQTGDFKGMVKTQGGETIREFDIWDNRYQMADVITTDNESANYLTSYMTYTEDADFTLIVPYQEDQMHFELYDKKSGALLKSINLSPAISHFKSSYPKEPGGTSSSLPPLDSTVVFLVTGIVLFLVLMGMTVSMMRKK